MKPEQLISSPMGDAEGNDEHGVGNKYVDFVEVLHCFPLCSFSIEASKGRCEDGDDSANNAGEDFVTGHVHGGFDGVVGEEHIYDAHNNNNDEG